MRIAAWLECEEPDREVLRGALWIGLYMKGLLADELFTILEIGCGSVTWVPSLVRDLAGGSGVPKQEM